jgi:WD40 repeat protein
MTSIETVTTVKFSPDGRVLVTCLSNKTVDVWKEKQSGDGNNVWVCVETLPEQTGEITSVAFYQSEENLILAIGLGDNTIKIWELSSDETKSSCIDTLAGHSSWVTSIAFHPYLKSLASGSNDKTVKVWVPNNGRFICRLTLNEHKSPVCSVAFSPSGFLASGSTNDRCKIWRLIISATCVNAELILTKFVEKGIKQLEFCQKTCTLRICHYDGVSTLE